MELSASVHQILKLSSGDFFPFEGDLLPAIKA